jgi:recombination protein RecR
MKITSEALERAIEELAKLPGTGRKSARRMALHLLKQPESSLQELASAISNLKTKVNVCTVCGTFSDTDPCAICENSKRAIGQLCVVEEFQDMYFIEQTNQFQGQYHVLGGVLSPMNQIGPDELRIKELIQRIHQTDVDTPINEVILALNPDAEGEATSYYIQKLMEPLGVNVTRIAYGIPMGTDLEYIDDATLTRAFSNRTSF